MATFNTELIANCPQIPDSEVSLLWHGDYWDGPIDGLLRYHGEECWFERIAENEDRDAPWFRRFVIVRLTPEQLADEQFWHELFRTHVGTHTDYDDPCGVVHPEEGMYLFYERYKERIEPNYSGNQILGWFEM